MSPVFPLTAALLCLALCACGSVRNLTAKSADKRRQRAMEKLAETSGQEAKGRLGAGALGEVAALSASADFVVIRVLKGAVLPKDAVLESRRGGTTTSELRLSPEIGDGFQIADITKGDPAVGDSIVLSGKQASRLVEVQTVAAAPLGSTASDPVNAGLAAGGAPVPPPPAAGAAGNAGTLDLPPLDQQNRGDILNEPPRILQPEDIIRDRVSAAPPPEKRVPRSRE